MHTIRKTQRGWDVGFWHPGDEADNWYHLAQANSLRAAVLLVNILNGGEPPRAPSFIDNWFTWVEG